jgi:hypothetical protein
MLKLPTVPTGGAKTLIGALVFGIGTAKNNGLGDAKVLTLEGDLYLTTLYKGQTLSMSYIDSGSNMLYFNDSSIPQCSASSVGAGAFCPPSTLSLTAVNRGKNGVTAAVSFTVANADSLFAHASLTAFDDIASPAGGGTSSFDWGLPFFIGRSVFFAFDGAETPGGRGPFVAY